jgi:hypothetical protein
MELESELPDDHIMIRFEKASKGHRKYEFFSAPWYNFKPTRNGSYHEIIHRSSNLRAFFDIDHSTPDLFHRFLQIAQDFFLSAFGVPAVIKYLHNPTS